MGRDLLVDRMMHHYNFQYKSYLGLYAEKFTKRLTFNDQTGFYNVLAFERIECFIRSQ